MHSKTRSEVTAHLIPAEHRASDKLIWNRPAAVPLSLHSQFNGKDDTMNWDQIQGKWKQLKGDVQSKWGELTDDEVDEVKGDREALEGKIQAKYGKTKEEAKKEVDEFLASM